MDNTNIHSGHLLGYIVATLLIALLIWYLVRLLQSEILDPDGKRAPQRTRRILRRFGRIRGFRVLSDLTLTANGKTVHIENMLIGYFGILLVKTCGARGDCYGTLDDKNWVLVQRRISEASDSGGGKRTVIPNLVKEQQEAIPVLREIFAKNKIYKTPIEQLVYFSCKSRRAPVYITHNGELIMPHKLSGYLRKTKFEADNGLDVQKIAQVLLDSADSAQSAPQK